MEKDRIIAGKSSKKRFADLLMITALLLFLQSCSFKSDDLILDETNGKVYELYDVFEDESGNKGVVVFVNSSNFSNGYDYIVVLSADETTAAWGKRDQMVSPYDSLRTAQAGYHQFGLMMLQQMEILGLENFPAQEWCARKNNSSSYSGSWRLPNHQELRYLKNKVAKINETLMKIGGDLVDENALYWTCVEDIPGVNIINMENPEDDELYDPAARAIPLTPKDQTYYDKEKWLKTNEYHVRAIKFVYYGR